MKSVIISIKPYWVFLIIAKTMGWNIDKEKTVEVRKTCPKDDDWTKIVKIYCTKDRESFDKIPKEYQPFMERFLSKVIGEFMCDDITKFAADEKANNILLSNMELRSCVGRKQLVLYAKANYYLYGWHISDLVIYDKPKELSEFAKLCNHNCFVPCPHYRGKEYECERPIITRPPQSWCYCEEVEK